MPTQNLSYMYNSLKMITYGKQVAQSDSHVPLSRTYVYDRGGGSIGPPVTVWTCPSA